MKAWVRREEVREIRKLYRVRKSFVFAVTKHRSTTAGSRAHVRKRDSSVQACKACAFVGSLFKTQILRHQCHVKDGIHNGNGVGGPRQAPTSNDTSLLLLGPRGTARYPTLPRPRLCAPGPLPLLVAQPRPRRCAAAATRRRLRRTAAHCYNGIAGKQQQH